MFNILKKMFLYIYLRPLIFMPLIIFLWGIFYFIFGPVINVDGGLGYDGHYYGHYTRRFLSMVFGNEIDSYRIQRIFPSFMVFLGMKILNIPNSFPRIIKSFQIYNMILLMLSSVLWYKIALIFRLKCKYIWLGFVFWFLNFGVAELSFYYPVLTDVTALFLGFWLMYAYYRDKLYLKIFITIIGAFTWANFIYLGMILIIFPVNFKFDLSVFGNEKYSLKKRLFIFLLPLPFLILGVYHFTQFLNNEIIPDIETDIINSTLYISVLLNYLFMLYFFSSYLPGNMLLKDYFLLLKKTLFSIKPVNIIISLALFVIIFVVQKSLSNDLKTDNSILKMIYLMSLYGATKPLIYIVTYINNFGPVFIIFFIYLKNFNKHLYEMGAGIYIFFVIPFLTIFATEARMNIFFLPFFILPVVLILRNLNISKLVCLMFLVISFVFSKVYIPMLNMPDSNPDKMTFHNQLIYMNFFTISNKSYFILSVLIIILSSILMYTIRKTGKPLPENQTEIF